ncbi:hypothetical protein HNR07_004888 [Nocardiopsis metallicus]|uniref:Uncharacterized protein n=1 Tax=Nocardiopsis metallicus TaxID=179819 RepID=A0A840WL76_9ACTN|nr:hypothetical protein [Nocardiopsis metallicus]
MTSTALAPAAARPRDADSLFQAPRTSSNRAGWSSAQVV